MAREIADLRGLEFQREGFRNSKKLPFFVFKRDLTRLYKDDLFLHNRFLDSNSGDSWGSRENVSILQILNEKSAFLRPQYSLKSKTSTNELLIGYFGYPQITKISERTL